MSKITTKETIYKNFGKCLEITNGTISMLVTIDVGPRIIRYGFCDGENILYEDLDREVYKDNLTPFDGATWYLYGGHRLWASPEAFPRTYYPDNDPVEYITTDSGACFMPPVQKWNQHSHKITITMNSENGDVKITHEIKNEGAWPVTLSVWPITALASGGIEVVPHSQKETTLIPNRSVSLWPYAKMNDKRVLWGDKFIILKQDDAIDDNFKFGTTNDCGYAMYFVHNNLLIKRFDVCNNGKYPDGGVCFESYVCKHYPEMETLSPLTELDFGESVCHNEYWSLYKEDYPGDSENKIEGLVKKYVK